MVNKPLVCFYYYYHNASNNVIVLVAARETRDEDMFVLSASVLAACKTVSVRLGRHRINERGNKQQQTEKAGARPTD